MQYFASEYDRKYAEYEKYQADHKQINTTAGKLKHKIFRKIFISEKKFSIKKQILIIHRF